MHTDEPRSEHLHATGPVSLEGQFQLLVESVSDYAIYILTPEGNIATWNKGARALKGYTAEEVIGKHFSIFYRPEDRYMWEHELREAARTGRFEDEGWRVRKDGQTFWANVIVTALRDPDGKLVGFGKVTRDLSKRRQNEEELRLREAQLREAQAIAHIGSWQWDVARDVIEWSDELFKIFGLEKTGFDSSFKAYLSRLPAQEQDRIERIIRNSLRTGAAYSFEQSFSRPDGQTRHLQSRGRAITDSEGRVTKLIGTSQDITERKKIEEELRKAHSELEMRVQERTAQLHEALAREKEARENAQAATEAKMRFLANMSHEIRTPMNAILGFSELLASSSLSTVQQEYLARIRTNGDQLLRLIDDILELSKFEAGKIPLDPIRFRLLDLVNDAVTSLTPMAKKKDLQIEARLTKPVPMFLRADPQRVRQILTNLLGNAIKFSHQGRVTLDLSIEEGSEGPELCFDVTDTGIGISEEDQSKLFQPFSQADSSIARRFGGTGLGLTLSRHIARSMGGDLVLRSSRPHAGSCFRFSLKLTREDTQTLTAHFPKETLRPAKEEPSLVLKDAPMTRVLLAEDSADNELLIRMYLESAGFRVDTAVNGYQALEMAGKTNYDLILMDIQMPGLDGLEATRRLRADGCKVPIVALTAHALKEEMDRSIEAGCNIHLTKPIRRRELLETISKQLHMES